MGSKSKSATYILAALGLFGVCGLGHFYLGRFEKGLFFLFGYWFLLFLFGFASFLFTFPFVILLPFLFWVWSFFDAGKEHRKYRRRLYSDW